MVGLILVVILLAGIGCNNLIDKDLQTALLSGTVTDSEGIELPGVEVFENASSNASATTDSTGRYTVGFRNDIADTQLTFRKATFADTTVAGADAKQVGRATYVLDVTLQRSGEPLSSRSQIQGTH